MTRRLCFLLKTDLLLLQLLLLLVVLPTLLLLLLRRWLLCVWLRGAQAPGLQLICIVGRVRLKVIRIIPHLCITFHSAYISERDEQCVKCDERCVYKCECV